MLLSAALIGCAAAQNASGSYDWLGTAIPRGPYASSLPQPDWLSPSAGAYSTVAGISSTYSPYGYDFLQIASSDPFLSGLTVEGGQAASNRLYVQLDGVLTTSGRVALGQPYVLWANVGNWGAFYLYDQNNLVLSQSYLAPGWYRIGGGYSDAMGTHLFRFVSAGQSSNSLSLVVESGGYLTSFGLTGRVVDQGGNGIGGATVIATSSEGGVFTSTSNALGYYGMNLPSGIYLVTAQAAGYRFTQPAARVISELSSAAPDVVGYPDQVAAAAGTIGTTGTTATGITTGTTATGTTTGTTATGTTAIGTAATGAALTTGSSGTSTGQAYVVPGSQFSGIQYYSSSYTGLLQGRVADQSGGGIPGAAITVDGFLTGIVTDDSGSYSIELASGMHRIEASKAGWGIPPRVVFVPSGGSANLILVARGTVALGSGSS